MSTQQSTVTTVYKVTGMSCGHCENAIREELTEVAGVLEVSASAKEGLVTVTSTEEPEEAAVRAAVDEAGYELVGRA
ncbi:heavy-metal-associated domain-containing protein [Streptomyces sp. XM4193]|uniref:heavy-metal-associated domain-containing protein n=1 Tax=Streptomyces sp. XM4193 TaxID=2929782 RepID=UPI001FFB0CA0|nr:heavy-metal-associated domain-containing protein [Streptomyces sp. XM4193]MCK1798605.1 heavy-metal-associated domain-containing protein [Streptomyces sp. XM4193]